MVAVGGQGMALGVRFRLTKPSAPMGALRLPAATAWFWGVVNADQLTSTVPLAGSVGAIDGALNRRRIHLRGYTRRKHGHRQRHDSSATRHTGAQVRIALAVSAPIFPISGTGKIMLNPSEPPP